MGLLDRTSASVQELLAIRSRRRLIDAKGRHGGHHHVDPHGDGGGHHGSLFHPNTAQYLILRCTTSGEIPIFSDIVLIAPSGFFQYLNLLKTVKNVRKYAERAFRTDLCRS